MNFSYHSLSTERVVREIPKAIGIGILVLCSTQAGIGKSFNKGLDSVALRAKGQHSEVGGRMKSRFLKNQQSEEVFEDLSSEEEDIQPLNELVQEYDEPYEAEVELDESKVGLLAEYFQQKDEPVDTSWKGYLHEKGPSEIMIKKEETRSLEPLSDEIWSLIMGSKTIHDTFDETVDLRRKVLDENHVQIKKTPLEVIETVIEEPAEKPAKQREELDMESLEVENDAESYQQLMELFNRPVLAMPTPQAGENEGMVSFRGQGSGAPRTVRSGSAARFEIRKN